MLLSHIAASLISLVAAAVSVPSDDPSALCTAQFSQLVPCSSFDLTDREERKRMWLEMSVQLQKDAADAALQMLLMLHCAAFCVGPQSLSALYLAHC